MESPEILTLVIIAFIAGMGWGHWYSEREIRRQRSRLEKGRVVISIPMDPDDAASMMRRLTGIVKKAKLQKEES